NRTCKLEARGRLLLQNDTSKDFFVAYWVGSGDDRHLGDGGVLGERGLHLQRGDVLAGAADDVLDPVDEVELAVLGAAHRVAGVEPAAVPGLFGGGRILEVARKEAAPGVGSPLTNQQLRGLFVKSYFKIFGWTTKAPRPDVPRLAARNDQCAAAGLGHGPGLGQGEAEARLERGVVARVGIGAEAEAHPV